MLDIQRDGYGATGMAAAIVIRGRLFWAGGSGLANRATKAPVTADTPFPIFSITKSFVGALAVKLAQEGRLKLDDPLSGALPDWPNADRITLRTLLNQTSGVGTPSAAWNVNRSAAACGLDPRGRPCATRAGHMARPGEKWEYNNANYILAGLVIEHATGGTVAGLLRELILDPLKLRDAVLQPQERPRSEPPTPTAARRRSPALCGPAVATRRTRPRPPGWTAGGRSSAPVVARFGDALLRGDLLSPDWRRQLLQFVPATGLRRLRPGGRQGPDVDRGGGWAHLGEGPGFSASVVHHAREGDHRVGALERECPGRPARGVARRHRARRRLNRRATTMRCSRPLERAMRVVAEGLAFPEGPVAMDDGSVLISEIRTGTIARVDVDGSVVRIAETGGGPNGAALGPDGKLYVCNNGGSTWTQREDGLTFPGRALAVGGNQPPDYIGGRIQVVDLSSGEVSDLYSECDGERLTAPNDIVFDAHGGFYFTDSGKRRERDWDYGGLYYATTDGTDIRELAYPLTLANGVGLSPDGERVYVAETTTARVWWWNIGAPGRLAPGSGPGVGGATLLTTLTDYRLIDSLAVEADGNICLATLMFAGITVVSPTGEIVAAVKVADDDPIITNICFGGEDLRTAYITSAGRGRLYAADWPRPGLALHGQSHSRPRERRSVARCMTDAPVHVDDVPPSAGTSASSRDPAGASGAAIGRQAVGVAVIEIDPGKRSTPRTATPTRRSSSSCSRAAGSSYQRLRPRTRARMRSGAGDFFWHPAGGDAHTLIAGPEGIKVLVVAEGSRTHITSLPRTKQFWLGPWWTPADTPHPFAADAKLGPLEVPAPRRAPADDPQPRGARAPRGPRGRAGAYASRFLTDKGRGQARARPRRHAAGHAHHDAALPLHARGGVVRALRRGPRSPRGQRFALRPGRSGCGAPMAAWATASRSAPRAWSS